MSKLAINIDRCKGCGLCIEFCPKKILAFAPETLNANGFHPAQMMDQEKCIACAMCAAMCPDVAISVEK